MITLVVNELHGTHSRFDRYADLVDDSGATIGTIGYDAHSGTWAIQSAGSGVLIPERALTGRFTRIEDALAAVQEVRRGDSKWLLATEGGLTRVERDVLDFEGSFRFAHPGSREQAIIDLFGMTRTRYAQVLTALVERPEAALYAPVVVNRLRRLAETRRAARARYRGPVTP